MPRRNHNLTTHDPSKCSGQHCVIHNPSDHHMRKWPTFWRDDLNVMERTCPHGVGHPDPDDAAHKIRIGLEGLTLHGCDGCCIPLGQQFHRPAKCPRCNNTYFKVQPDGEWQCFGCKWQQEITQSTV